MTVEASPAHADATPQRRFAAEVLHSLSQPLTALHCALELSLLRDHSADEFRKSVNSALESAGRLRQRLLLLSELNDADNPGDTSHAVRLDRLVMRLWEDLLPLADSVGMRFEPISGPFWVHGNELKVANALLFLLEWLLRASVPDTSITLAADGNADQVQIIVAAQARPEAHFPTNCQPGESREHQLEVASRIFQAAGGRLAIIHYPYHQTRCVIEMPTVFGPSVA